MIGLPIVEGGLKVERLYRNTAYVAGGYPWLPQADVAPNLPPRWKSGLDRANELPTAQSTSRRIWCPDNRARGNEADAVAKSAASH
jgi:hypothetical protein